MDKLQAMGVFVSVVDAGSFTRAAQNMQLPKATVSTLVSGLETSLSLKLLNRTTRQISVTADGAAYYEHCVRILADLKDVEESLSRKLANPSGRLRIDVPTGIGRYLIIPALPKFFEQYPEIQLEMGCSDRLADLIEEGIDCVVRGGDLTDSSLVARRIGSMRMVTCATPDYLAKYGRPMHPSDLARHRCINYFSSKTGKYCEWEFLRNDEVIQMKLEGRLAVNDSDAYTEAALAGIGVAQLPLFALQPHLQSGAMELVLQEWCTGPIPLHVVYPQNRHLSAKVRAFVEWVAELFSTSEELNLHPYHCSKKPQAALAAAQPSAVRKSRKVPA